MQIQPRLRTDLVAQPLTDEGQEFVDVTDPSSGSTFRFYEVEYLVACAMDGERDLSSLATWSKVALGVEANADELSIVVNTLSELGYLDSKERGDMELGVPGRSSMLEPAKAPTIAGEDIELGRPGASDVDNFASANAGAVNVQGKAAETAKEAAPTDDVSVDLSKHLSLGKDEVKEAIRQSRVMSTAKAADQPSAPAEKATELAKKEAEADKEPAASAKTAATEEKSSDGVALLVAIVVLVILGIGGVYVYKSFMAKKNDDSSAKPVPAESESIAKKLAEPVPGRKLC